MYITVRLQIIDFDVFLKGNFLPLTNSITYNLYHVLPLPIQVNNTNSKFIFLLPECEYLLMDTAKQYFARLRADELASCKSISSRHRVCKQNQPLQLTHLDEEWEAQMLQAVRTILSTCLQRIAELNQFGLNWKIMSGYLLPRNLRYLPYYDQNTSHRTSP